MEPQCGFSSSDPNRSQLCSHRDLWHQEKVLEMQREVQEHIPRDRGSSRGGYFGKAAPGRTKGGLCRSLWMPGRGFGTSCSIINQFGEGINTSWCCLRGRSTFCCSGHSGMARGQFQPGILWEFLMNPHRRIWLCPDPIVPTPSTSVLLLWRNREKHGKTAQESINQCLIHGESQRSPK